MKAITIQQPWAALVAIGAKQYETRSWWTKHTGEIAIHASGKCSQAIMDMGKTEPFAGVLNGALIDYGAIIAVADLTFCFRCDTLEVENLEAQFGDFSPGRFAWELTNVRTLKFPVHCKGKQGLWNVPVDIESKVREQLAMPAPLGATTKPRPRTVFGRRTVTIDGAKYRFEMAADGLEVRRRHSRKPVKISFVTLLERIKNQFDLPLQPKLKL